MAYFSRIFDDAIVLKEIGDTRQGMATSDNGRFLRLWHEVGHSRIGFGLANSNVSRSRGSKWIPYNKGGDFRKWWGNQNSRRELGERGRRTPRLCTQTTGVPHKQSKA